MGDSWTDVHIPWTFLWPCPRAQLVFLSHNGEGVRTGQPVSAPERDSQALGRGLCAGEQLAHRSPQAPGGRGFCEEPSSVQPSRALHPSMALPTPPPHPCILDGASMPACWHWLSVPSLPRVSCGRNQGLWFCSSCLAYTTFSVETLHTPSQSPASREFTIQRPSTLPWGLFDQQPKNNAEGAFLGPRAGESWKGPESSPLPVPGAPARLSL